MTELTSRRELGHGHCRAGELSANETKYLIQRCQSAAVVLACSKSETAANVMVQNHSRAGVVVICKVTWSSPTPSNNPRPSRDHGRAQRSPRLALISHLPFLACRIWRAALTTTGECHLALRWQSASADLITCWWKLAHESGPRPRPPRPRQVAHPADRRLGPEELWTFSAEPN